MCSFQLIKFLLKIQLKYLQQKRLQPLVDKLRHDHVVACIGLVLKGLHEFVVVWQAHVVVLQPVEAVHHVGAAGVHS